MARLVEVLRTGKLPRLRSDAETDLVELAVRERVAGLLKEVAGEQFAGHPGTLLSQACRRQIAVHLSRLVALARVGSALDAAGIPWVVIKGPVLAELAYAGAARSYDDVDLLVSPERFGAAVAILEGMGAILHDRNWPLLRKEDRAELHLADGTEPHHYDLHWHLVNIGWMRRGPQIATDELLERRRPCSEVGAPVLDPTDRFLHYALHALISGGDRLLWLADLRCALVNDPPDWDLLVERSRAQAVTVPVAVMLARTELALGTGPPDGVLQALAGTGWRRWLVAWLRRWRTGGRLPGGGSINGAVTRALADSPSRTALNTARLAAGTVERVYDRYPHWADPDDPGHILYDDGGRAGREAYLRSVLRHDRFGHLPPAFTLR